MVSFGNDYATSAFFKSCYLLFHGGLTETEQCHWCNHLGLVSNTFARRCHWFNPLGLCFAHVSTLLLYFLLSRVYQNQGSVIYVIILVFILNTFPCCCCTYLHRGFTKTKEVSLIVLPGVVSWFVLCPPPVPSCLWMFFNLSFSLSSSKSENNNVVFLGKRVPKKEIF